MRPGQWSLGPSSHFLSPLCPEEKMENPCCTGASS